MAETQDESTKQPARFWQRIKLFIGHVSHGLFLVVCLLLCAGLFYISYPKISFSFAAWFIVAPFIWGICHIRGFWGSVFYGWLAGLVSNAVLLSWIYYTCLNGGGLSHALSLTAWLGLSGLLALQFAVFGGACHFLKKTGGFFPILAACGWVALEWLHQMIAFYGLGFPWVMLGYTQWNVPAVLYIASFTGVYGISFLLCFVGSSVGWCFGQRGLRKGLWQLVLATIVFVSVYGFGRHMQHKMARFLEHPRSLLTVQAALLQPNIDQYKKWTPEYEEEIANTLKNMGQQLSGTGTYLAVWPESVVPGSLTDEKYFNLFADIGKQSAAYQVLGSNIATEQAQYVGAYLMTPDGEGLSAYRKEKLVPFGEFIPFERLLQYVLKDIEVMGALGSFVPGPRGQPLLDAGGVKLGTTVCYESIFPQLWRQQNKTGAQLFVNITNDAWFFNTAAPYQHLAANVLRAVENGRPVLRAANTGFSAYIDAFGNIKQQSNLFTQEILTASVPLSVTERNTFYTQWGDWFAWICAILFFTIGISTIVFLYE